MKTMGVILFSLVMMSFAGCAGGPPKRVQSAIGVMNKYMPEYVDEANKALADHPDGERLIGIGKRLQVAMDALDRWARGEVAE